MKIKTLFCVSSLMCLISVVAIAKPAQKRKVASGARVGSSVVAELSPLSASDSKINIATIESQQVVKKIQDGRIALVQVDQGGSTDIGSLMASSRLMFVFFRDGEMHNRSAAFDLGGVNSYSIEKNDAGKLTLKLNCKDSSLKAVSVNAIINYADMEKEMLKNDAPAGAEDFDDVFVSGKVVMTGQCLPPME